MTIPRLFGGMGGSLFVVSHLPLRIQFLMFFLLFIFFVFFIFLSFIFVPQLARQLPGKLLGPQLHWCICHDFLLDKLNEVAFSLSA